MRPAKHPRLTRHSPHLATYKCRLKFQFIRGSPGGGGELDNSRVSYRGQGRDEISGAIWVVETSRPPETPVYPPLVIQKGPGPLYLQGGARGLEKKGG